MTLALSGSSAYSRPSGGSHAVQFRVARSRSVQAVEFWDNMMVLPQQLFRMPQRQSGTQIESPGSPFSVFFVALISTRIRLSPATTRMSTSALPAVHFGSSPFVEVRWNFARAFVRFDFSSLACRYRNGRWFARESGSCGSIVSAQQDRSRLPKRARPGEGKRDYSNAQPAAGASVGSIFRLCG